MLGIACPGCAYLIGADADGRLPPWCPKCGADLKPGAAGSAVVPVMAEPAPVAAVTAPTPVPAVECPPAESWERSERAVPRRPSGLSGLSVQLALVGSVLGSMLVPQYLLPFVPPYVTEGGFDLSRLLLAGFGGGVGALAGALLGQAFRNPYERSA